MSREIIVTGGDAGFFSYLIAALDSLRAQPATRGKDYGVIDQGLSTGQREQLLRLGCRVVRPEWTLPVPEAQRQLRSIGLVARTALRDYFPGYEFYLWFDADAWVQTPEFLASFVEGARTCGAAVAREDGPGYRRSLRDLRWWWGNKVAAYGVRSGVRLGLETSVNIGVLCLKDTAPHWDAWKRAYVVALERTGKVNMDQHAFLAAAHLEQLPTAFLPARCDWLPHLSCPTWNRDTRRLCEPTAPYRPLSVIHLAGPNKDRTYHIPVLGGGRLATPLTFHKLGPRLLKDGQQPEPLLSSF